MNIDPRYWAGLFDGEGNIYFAKDLIHIKVGVTQKEIPILIALHSRFGGSIHRYGYQNCHKWEVFNRRDCEKFLKTVSPYCIIKAVEIQIALEALSGWSKRHNAGKALPETEMERRKILWEKFMSDRNDPNKLPEHFKLKDYNRTINKGYRLY